MWPLAVLLASAVGYAQPAPDETPTTEPATEPATESATAPDAPTPEDIEQRARVLFRNGKRLFDEGSYEAAIEAWEACYDLSQRIALLYNLSNAYERLGNYQRSLDLLNSYRAQADLADEEHERLSRKASTLEMRAREASAVTETTKRKRTRSRGRTVAGTTLVATGTAAIIAGAVLGSIAIDARSEVDDSCVELMDGFMCTDAGVEPIRRAEQTGTAAIVALAAGGVGVLSGVTVFATGGQNPKAAVEVTFRF